MLSIHTIVLHFNNYLWNLPSLFTDDELVVGWADGDLVDEEGVGPSARLVGGLAEVLRAERRVLGIAGLAHRQQLGVQICAHKVHYYLFNEYTF